MSAPSSAAVAASDVRLPGGLSDSVICCGSGDGTPSPWDGGQIIEARADGLVDAEIVLLGRHDLAAADFVL